MMTPVSGGFAPPGYADSLGAEMRAVLARSPGGGGTNPYQLYARSIFHLGQGDVASAKPFVERGLAMDSARIDSFGGQWIRGLQQAASGYLRAQARGQGFGGGYFDHQGQLWAEGGALLATTHQVMYYKE